MDEYSNTKVSDLIYRSPATAGFTRQDWLDLAMAALDQGGVQRREYAAIEAMLPEVDAEEAGLGLSAEDVTLPFCACGRVVSRCDGSRVACNSKRLTILRASEDAGDKADNRRGG